MNVFNIDSKSGIREPSEELAKSNSDALLNPKDYGQNNEVILPHFTIVDISQIPSIFKTSAPMDDHLTMVQLKDCTQS